MFLYYALLFFLGLAAGSFAGVVIHRLHRREKGIVFGRSKCPKCQAQLGAVDLIPLVGFVVNKFRCRFCKEPIALSYPFLELVMGALFFHAAAMVGMTDVWRLTFTLLMVFAFVTLTFYDILFQEVPDSVALSATALAVLYALLAKPFGWTALLIGMAVPLVFFGMLFFVSQGRWLGGGDLRIGALMGAVLGWPKVAVGLFLAYLIGSVYSAIGMMMKKLNRKSQIPFAPFLLIGAYVAWFWGDKLIAWYLNLA